MKIVKPTNRVTCDITTQLPENKPHLLQAERVLKGIHGRSSF
jgi:hypothetical protein